MVRAVPASEREGRSLVRDHDANKQPICYIGATEVLNAAKLARGGGGTACR